MDSGVKIVAQSLGIESLDDRIAAALAPDVEYRIRHLVQDGLKFAEHAQRDTLTVEDINAALRVRNVEGLYGFSGLDSMKFTKIGDQSEDLFMLKDKVESFATMLAEPVLKCPMAPSFTTHWLAVEGVQPTIPQNPTLKSKRGDGSSDELVAKRSKHAEENDKQVKLLVKHVLSHELRLYFEKVTAAILGDDEAQKKLVFASLAADPGLQQLVPYFAKFISDEVAQNLRKLPLLVSLMRMLRFILLNPHLQVELYLHQLMSPLFTCLVGRRLCAKPTEDHWALRDEAASLVATVCTGYGPLYSTLQPRITKTLHDAFMNSSRPLTTHYGSIIGISRLGPQVTELLLLPQLSAYAQRIQPFLAADHPNPVKRLEAQKCYGALLNAVGQYVRTKLSDAAVSRSGNKVSALGSSNNAKGVSFRQLMEVFGENLFPYLGTGIPQPIYRSATITRVRPQGTKLGAKRTAVATARKPTKYELVLAKLKLQQDNEPTFDVKYDSGYVEQAVPRSCITKPKNTEEEEAKAAAAKAAAAKADAAGGGANADATAAPELAEQTRVYARCAVVEQTYLSYCL